MFRYRRFIIPLMALPLIFGCTRLHDTAPYPQPSVSHTVVEEVADYIYGDCMPVLAINTTERGSNAMDFVTKPVTRHVAESIASWTPNYRIPTEPYYTECTVTLTDTDEMIQLDRVGAQVKVRGNWTTVYEKKPLRIKFDEKQSMLGLNDGGEYRNWVLLVIPELAMQKSNAVTTVCNGRREVWTDY